MGKGNDKYNESYVSNVLNKIVNLRMKTFNSVGDTVTFSGAVTAVDESSAQVNIDLHSESENGETVTAEATITLPK